MIDGNRPGQSLRLDALPPVFGNNDAKGFVMRDYALPRLLKSVHINTRQLKLPIQVAAHRVPGQIELLAHEVRLLQRSERKRGEAVARICGRNGRPVAGLRRGHFSAMYLFNDASCEIANSAAFRQPLHGNRNGKCALKLKYQPGCCQRIQVVIGKCRIECSRGPKANPSCKRAQDDLRNLAGQVVIRTF